MPSSVLLNDEQKQAVFHGEGPLLIIAGAGTGKTAVVTERIKHLIVDKEINPSDILALTFTEKAAREMETRVDIALPYGYTQMWIATFHAFCDQVLREDGIHIGLNPDYRLTTEAEAILFLRKNLFKLELEYFRPLGNPYKFIGGLLTHFSRLKDDDITPEQYLQYAENLRKNSEADPEIDPLEIKKTLELANAYKIYEELKVKEGIMDFSDLNANVLKLFRQRSNVLSYYQNKFKYIMVDEFQDTNYAQNELAILLAGKRQNISVVGDDDQCLVKDTLINTPSGKKKIQYLKEGDEVYTGVGRGAIGVSTIQKVFKNQKKTVFVTITTKSGKVITATANHKFFCYIPKRVAEKKLHYVYLMHRKNLGWRLGTTNDLAQRLRLERSADAILGLRVFPTLEDALYHETLWSLTYQLPTCVFKERENTVMQGVLAEKLFSAFDTNENAKRLATDLGIDLNSYHYILDAVERGQSHRIKINLSMCHRIYKSKRTGQILKNPSILHQVHVQTTNQAVIEIFKSHRVSFMKANKGIRIKKSFSSLAEADDFAQYLAQITGGFLEISSSIGILNSVSLPAQVMPAGNVIEGCYLPVTKDGKTIYYDEIVSISREEKKELVYDLEIKNTHNFFANDIAVHNSIYRWRGAAMANITQFRTHFPNAKIVTLNKNYRSTEEILTKSHQMIQHNNPDRLEVKEKVNKQLLSMRELKGDPIEFLFGNRVEQEAEQVVQKIIELKKKKKLQLRDFAILVRANDHAQPFVRALESAKIPYQFLGPGHLFHQEEVKDFISYLRVLYNFEDSAALYRVITHSIFGLNARDIAALLNFTKKKNLSLFEAIEQVSGTFLPDDCKEKITGIAEMVHRHLQLVPRSTAGQILYYFFEDSGLLKKFLAPDSPFVEKQAQNIAKFFEKLKSYEAEHEDASVFAVVDWIDLSMQLGESPLATDMDWSENNAVNILTVHSSKGLEFPVVFIVNLVSQRFPTRARREQIPLPADLIREDMPEGDQNVAEERRLFYVAMTRARDNLFLTAANYYGEGKRERKLSPFVIEALGESTVEKVLNKNRLESSVKQLSLLDVLPSQTEDQSNHVLQPTSYALNYVSYSQIQTYEMCPLHYKLRYILKLPSQPVAPLSFGSSVHAVLKEYYHALTPQGTQQPEDLEKLLQRYWIKEGYESKSHAETAYKQALTVLQDYVKKDTGKVLATEIPFQFSLGTLKVGGRIDRVDSLGERRIEIIDYKTGTNVPKEKDLEKNLQLTFYALAATQVHDSIFNKTPEQITLSLHYLEEGVKLSTTRTKEQLEDAKEIIKQKVQEIAQSDFICSITTCKDCEYKMICQTYAG